MTTQRITLPIYNLGCGGGGTLSIERALAKVPGVAYAYVNPLTEMAYIEFDPALANPEQLVAVIDHLGYGVPRVAPRRDHASAAGRPTANQWDTRQRAIAAGLGLAAIYALGVVVDLLFPHLFQIYRFWENVLIGVAWATPWTLLIGLVEAFLYGALVIWAFNAVYRALPGRARR